jgi:hypothetical protein
MAYDPLTKVDDGLSGSRRPYDVCIVFSYKTDSRVKYGTELDQDNVHLIDPTETESSVMHMWEMRRNTVVRALQGAGLDTKCIYSRDRDEIFCKVGASDEKLAEIAQLTKYKLRLKEEYESAYAEYRKDYVGTPPHYEDRRIVSHLFTPGDGGSPFRSVDRIRLIDRCIRSSDKGCAGVDMADMRRKIPKEKLKQEGLATSRGCCSCISEPSTYPGAVADYFPLAESAMVAGIHTKWYEVLNPHNKLDQVRDYFGEAVAFYWLWIGYMMKALAVLAVLGLGALFIELFAQTPNNFTAMPFSVCAGIWAVSVVHFWRRVAATRALSWGTLDLDDELLPPRKEFYGEKRINPVTERPELHYDWTGRIPAFIFSGVILAGSIVGLLLITLLLFAVRHMMHRGLWLFPHSPNAPLYFQFFNAILVEILNFQFSKMAKWRTEQENHRTDKDFQTHLLGKTMAFKFFNSYISLYYIAFFKGHDHQTPFPAPYDVYPKLRCRHNDCMVDLSSQLVCFMVVRMIFANLYEIIAPKVASCWESFWEDRALRGLAGGSKIVMFMGMSSMETQSKKVKPEMYEEMEELLITYGYCVLFVVAAPWMPFVVLVGCMIETALDKVKLFRLVQRPWPELVGHHEPWDTAFDLMGGAAMFTNIALVVFGSDQFDGYSRSDKITWFFVLENALLALRVAISVMLPARPADVAHVHQKHQLVVQKHLDCVETALDGTFFEDTAVTSKVLIMDRDEAEDDEEDF